MDRLSFQAPTRIRVLKAAATCLVVCIGIGFLLADRSGLLGENDSALGPLTSWIIVVGIILGVPSAIRQFSGSALEIDASAVTLRERKRARLYRARTDTITLLDVQPTASEGEFLVTLQTDTVPAVEALIHAEDSLEGVVASLNVPSGTCVAFYCRKGYAIQQGVGWAVSTGSHVGLLTPTEIFGPGSQVPNHNLTPPRELQVRGAVKTVDVETPLSDLLSENMGICHWAACRCDL